MEMEERGGGRGEGNGKGKERERGDLGGEMGEWSEETWKGGTETCAASLCNLYIGTQMIRV